jgi:hypothetical protein
MPLYFWGFLTVTNIHNYELQIKLKRADETLWIGSAATRLSGSRSYWEKCLPVSSPLAILLASGDVPGMTL